MNDAAASDRARRLVRALAGRLDARVIETHLSWVLLGRDQAWKLKKPLHLPFVDYGSLEARWHCCEEELRLNRRFADGLYLGLTRIGGTPEAPCLLDERDPTPAIEIAVHMRRFPAGALFGERLRDGRLAPADVDALAGWLVAVHREAPRAPPGSPHGSAAGRRRAVLGALAAAAPWLEAGLQDCLRAWIEAECASLEPLWTARQAGGSVRECHGDLHLDNLLWLDGRVQAFDALEFDPALRWIDVIDDLAFPVMDLHAQGQPALAFRLLAGWFDQGEGHDGLPALRLAVLYRALVRAMAHGLRGDTPGARRCIATAEAWRRPPPPRLAITHGLPGSGKTRASQRWLEAHGAIRLRSDVERKRLHGLGMLEDSRRAGLDLYGPETTRRTYRHLFERADQALRAGYPVVLDAAFLRREERGYARALATAHGCAFTILDCRAPRAELERRLRARRDDASEADTGVLARLADAAEPLEAAEQACAQVIEPDVA